jgi:amino-acid N-acetyltransferase
MKRILDALKSFGQVHDQIKVFPKTFVKSEWPEQHQTVIKFVQPEDRQAITTLLSKSDLPTEDLPDILSDFVIATAGGQIIGVAGLEIFGSVGLLRSVAVDGTYKGRGIAGKMIGKILTVAKTSAVQQLYLITTTADKYFERYGFIAVSRDLVPSPIQETQQISNLCPSSAVVMCLVL